MITDNFIKMCEKAEEIQKAWKPVDWDRFIYKDDRKYGILGSVAETGGNKEAKSKAKAYGLKHYIYLPTQEQLFEMHSKWYRKRYKGKMMISEYFLYLNEFAVIAEESKYKYYSPVEMMMGYLYQEKYSKEWTGEKWKEIL